MGRASNFVSTIAYPTLRNHMKAIARVYKEAWDSVNSVATEKTAAASLGEAVLTSAFELATAGMGRGLGILFKRSIREGLILTGMTNVVSAAQKAADQQISDAVGELATLPPAARHPDDYESSLLQRLNREIAATGLMLDRLWEHPDPRIDPYERVREATQIGGTDVTSLEVDSTSLAQRFERELWDAWLREHAVTQEYQGSYDLDEVVSDRYRRFVREQSWFAVPNSGTVIPHLLQGLGPWSFGTFDELKNFVFEWAPLNPAPTDALPGQPL